MRTLLPLLIVLLVAGCARPVAVLVNVKVNEVAAYPKQEPGTRPPVLTGTFSLTKEQLDEGWVQLFDGVSTYGWSVINGDSTISVKKWKSDIVLTCKRLAGEEVTLVHRQGNAMITFKENGGLNVGGDGRKGGFEGYYDTGHSEMYDFGFAGVKTVRGRPHDTKPLLEADWRPAAGETKAAWTDGVLELTGGLGMVETVKEYGDFVLQLEYFTEPGVNSGVFFRCIPGETLNGYECQIFNNPPAEDYDKFIGTDTGGIFRRCVGRNVGPKDGEWNYLTVAARGPMIATWVNGIQTVDWTDTRKEDENPRKGLRLKPGTIQLQGHDPGTKIKFRNFRLAEIE